MTPGEKISLAAMKKEHKLLSRRAANAEKKSKDAIYAVSNIFKIRQQAQEIISSGESWEIQAKQMEPLAKEEKRLINLTKLDINKLFDKEHELRFAADELGREIQMMEYRHGIYKKRFKTKSPG